MTEIKHPKGNVATVSMRYAISAAYHIHVSRDFGDLRRGMSLCKGCSWMPYQILCNGTWQKSQEVRFSLALTSTRFTPLHKIRYGIHPFIVAQFKFLVGENPVSLQRNERKAAKSTNFGCAGFISWPAMAIISRFRWPISLATVFTPMVLKR